MGVEVPGGAETADRPPPGLMAVAEQLTQIFDFKGVNTTDARLLLQQLVENAQVFPEDTDERWYHGEVPPHDNRPPRAIFLLERTEAAVPEPFWLRIFYSSDLPPSPHELQDAATRKALRAKLAPCSSQIVAKALIAATYILPSRQRIRNITPNPKYL